MEPPWLFCVCGCSGVFVHTGSLTYGWKHWNSKDGEQSVLGKILWPLGCKVRTFQKSQVFWRSGPELSPLNGFTVCENKEPDWITAKNHSSVPRALRFCRSPGSRMDNSSPSQSMDGTWSYLFWVTCSPRPRLMNGLHWESIPTPVDWSRTTLVPSPSLGTLCTLSLNNNKGKTKSSG